MEQLSKLVERLIASSFSFELQYFAPGKRYDWKELKIKDDSAVCKITVYNRESNFYFFVTGSTVELAAEEALREYGERCGKTTGA